MTTAWQESGSMATVWRAIRDAGRGGIVRHELKTALGNSVSKLGLGVYLIRLREGGYVQAVPDVGRNFRYLVTPLCNVPPILPDQVAAEHRCKAFRTTEREAEELPLCWPTPPNSVFDLARVMGLNASTGARV